MTGNEILRQIKLFIGVTGLLLATSACGRIIEIVPHTPTPSAATPQVQLSTPTAEAPRIPNRIVVEAINLDANVVEMGWRVVEQWGRQKSEWEMPEDEAAWHRNSARPGEGSNVVISGHNASTGGQVFADLEELQVGDKITLWTDNQHNFDYQVVEKNIIRTFAISDEADQYLKEVTTPTNQEQLTLITCWPRWSNTHRLIVIAQPLLAAN